MNINSKSTFTLHLTLAHPVAFVHDVFCMDETFSMNVSCYFLEQKHKLFEMLKS